MLKNSDLIRRMPLFSMLSDQQIDFLAEFSKKKRYKRGALITEQGKPIESLHIVLVGRVRVFTQHPDGRGVILSILGQGDYFGEYGLIEGAPHPYSTRAEVLTDVMQIHTSALNQYLPRTESIAQPLMQGLLEKMDAAHQSIESFVLMDVHGRVIRALLNSAEPDLNGELLVPKSISRSDIAQIVGASREMVSRVIKSLIQTGHIEIQQAKAIRILKPDLLRARLQQA